MRCHKFSMFGDKPCLVSTTTWTFVRNPCKYVFIFHCFFILYFFIFLHFSIHCNLPFGHIFFLRGSVLRFESNLSNRWTLWQRLSELSVGFLRRFRLKIDAQVLNVDYYRMSVTSRTPKFAIELFFSRGWLDVRLSEI